MSRNLRLAVLAIVCILFTWYLFISSASVFQRLRKRPTVTKAPSAKQKDGDVTKSKATPNLLFLKPNSPISERTIRINHPMIAHKEPTKSGKYSKFRCSGDDNDIDGYVERVCVFEHICYDRNQNEFQFYQRDTEEDRTILFEARMGEVKDFRHKDHGFVAVKQLFFAAVATEWDTFAPNLVKGESPITKYPDSTTVLAPVHVLWSTWAQDDNLGHVLWEEMAGIWFAMVRMNVIRDDVVAMHWPDKLPDRKLARKFREAFFPAISKSPPVGFDDYVSEVAQKKRYVCFNEMLVGGNVRRFLQRLAWHNYGHEPLFWSLRGRILQAFALDPYQVPKTHQIVITKKSSSNYFSSSEYKTHRSIYNFDEVVDFVKKQYPSVTIKVVDFKDYTIQEQLKLLLQTTVLITPSGGISMVLPFLPDGANAILLDYLEKEDSYLIGSKAGESVSMEAPFWNYWPHVKKLYYQVRSKDELRPDNPAKSIDEISWRDETSVLVDLKRLSALLEQAFENMTP
ncbi:hypothetical protein HDU97_004922 [Phlyctochytrium planicorne]|nr:hypothetical protein HDU97_004922 [Phlyctochytrium planicorne]